MDYIENGIPTTTCLLICGLVIDSVHGGLKMLEALRLVECRVKKIVLRSSIVIEEWTIIMESGGTTSNQWIFRRIEPQGLGRLLQRWETLESCNGLERKWML